MQIHELNTFVGQPGQGDYLAIDNGSETFKIGGDSLGVSTVMTQAEAEAGTVTDPRVITPKVLHDYVEENSVDTEMTIAEAEAGTVTDPRVIAPKVLHDYVEEIKPPVASIIAYAGLTAPDGWLICDGSAVSRTTYAELFSVIGTTYGDGDGSATFNLPDLKGRVIVGVGESSAAGHTAHALGQSGGEEKHTLSVNEMPSHAHDYRITGDSSQSSSSQVARFPDPTWNTKYQKFGGNVIEPTGGNQSHNIMQPYVVTNYIIKT